MEEFFSSYENTIAALGALGTVAAVFVSLWFSYKASTAHKPRIRVRIMRTTSLTDDRSGGTTWIEDSLYKDSKVTPQKTHEVVMVSIQNLGSYPVSVDKNFFCLQMRFFGKCFGVRMMFFPLLDDYTNPIYKSPNPPPIYSFKKSYPVEIKVGASEKFFVIALQRVIDGLNSDFKDLCWIQRFFIKALVASGFGGFFEAKMSKAFKNEIMNVGRI